MTEGSVVVEFFVACRRNWDPVFSKECNTGGGGVNVCPSSPIITFSFHHFSKGKQHFDAITINASPSSFISFHYLLDDDSFRKALTPRPSDIRWKSETNDVSSLVNSKKRSEHVMRVMMRHVVTRWLLLVQMKWPIFTCACGINVSLVFLLLPLRLFMVTACSRE